MNVKAILYHGYLTFLINSTICKRATFEFNGGRGTYIWQVLMLVITLTNNQ